jgi:hypothetical protein
MLNQLKVAKAVYYDPQKEPEGGTDVTAELQSEIRNNQLVYHGIYNSIFPDHFKRVNKKLRIEIEYCGSSYTKFYNENDRINLPVDLGVNKTKWWERSWVQIFMVLGAAASLIGLFFLLN